MIYLPKIAILFCLLSMNAGVLAQQRFTISGNIAKRYEGAEIKLFSAGQAFQELNTTAKNGKFQFTGEINQQYEPVTLSVSKNDQFLGGETFFIKGGAMEIKIITLTDKSSKSDIRYFNVPFIAEQEKYDALVKPFEDSLGTAFRLLDLIERGYPKEHSKGRYSEDSLAVVIKTMRAEIKNRKIKFVKEQPDAYIALYLFNKEILNNINLNADSLMAIYTAFNPLLKETDLGRLVYTDIRKKQSLLIHQMMPEFSFSTNDGQSYELSDLRQKKYILLCFWSAGCRPCIQSLPLLRTLDKKYQKDLQLISIWCDGEEKRWMQALEKYKLPWLQTCDLPAYIKGPSIKSLYDNHSTPQYFLIDKEGKLVYQNSQVDDDDDHNILQRTLGNLLP